MANMGLVPAKCKLCKQIKYIAEFQLNPHGCQECLNKIGKGHLFPAAGHRLKKKRIGKNKLARAAIDQWNARP